MIKTFLYDKQDGSPVKRYFVEPVQNKNPVEKLVGNDLVENQIKTFLIRRVVGSVVEVDQNTVVNDTIVCTRNGLLELVGIKPQYEDLRDILNILSDDQMAQFITAKLKVQAQALKRPNYFMIKNHNFVSKVIR